MGKNSSFVLFFFSFLFGIFFFRVNASLDGLWPLSLGARGCGRAAPASQGPDAVFILLWTRRGPGLRALTGTASLQVNAVTPRGATPYALQLQASKWRVVASQAHWATRGSSSSCPRAQDPWWLFHGLRPAQRWGLHTGRSLLQATASQTSHLPWLGVLPGACRADSQDWRWF